MTVKLRASGIVLLASTLVVLRTLLKRGLVYRASAVGVLLTLITSCSAGADYDVLLRGGSIYDGSGSAPVVADVAISGDTIAAIGPLT